MNPLNEQPENHPHPRTPADEVATSKLEHAGLFDETTADKHDHGLSSTLGSIGVDLVGLRPDFSRLETKAMIVEQIGGGSYRAYATVFDQLNHSTESPERTTKLSHAELTSELSKWMTDDKLQYVARLAENDSNLQFSLVVTPNVKVTTDRIIQLAKTFGQRQPNSTAVDESLMRKYEADELSGYDPNLDSPVRFKLYPSKLSPEFFGTVAEQKSKLISTQAEHPFLCVPSVLDDICHRQALREEDVKLVGREVFNRAYARHFDLEPKRIKGYLCVPYSNASSDGLSLGGSYVDFPFRARVLVG